MTTKIPYTLLANGTAGQLITWSAAGLPATVATGTSGHVLTSNGAGAAPTFQAAGGGSQTGLGDDIANISVFFNDFHNKTSVPAGNMFTTVTGTGAAVNNGYNSNTTTPNIQDTRGWVNLGTGTTTTGGAAVMLNDITGQGSWVIGDGEIDFSCRAVIPVLSTGSQRFVVRLGLPVAVNMTGIPTADSTLNDGIWFRYTDDVNSGNWQAVSMNGAVASTINTSVAASTGEVIFRIVVNAAASSIEFFINGASQGSITTNIPGSTDGLTPAVMIKKAGIGTTARYLYCDYMYAKTTRT